MNLYLHMEILEREFLPKLLIAMESASRGMNVYLGRLKPYIMRDFFSPGIRTIDLSNLLDQSSV